MRSRAGDHSGYNPIPKGRGRGVQKTKGSSVVPPPSFFFVLQRNNIVRHSLTTDSKTFHYDIIICKRLHYDILINYYGSQSNSFNILMNNGRLVDQQKYASYGSKKFVTAVFGSTKITYI